MNQKISKETESLKYHSEGRSGKIEVVATKPCQTADDLSLAYSPGVAGPCREINASAINAYQYTAKGNLVAVVTNGSAVLGLGNIGPLAGKPVMEGKGVLFKCFADIDVFDIELNAPTAEDVIRACEYLEPTFGGINLEDIKAPECFIIEQALKEKLSIPVFHDDQHGTAIIVGAAFINALELVDKQPGDVRILISGAGASGIACADLMVTLGAKLENILMCDSTGVIYKGRSEGMNPWKKKFARKTDRRNLTEAFEGADVALGLSVKGLFTKEMVASMNERPILFALANPDPEIDYAVAKTAKKDLIMATGRSDYPNQVNNVLGFPFIFRGTLDVQARTINEAMKIAASRALAALAKKEVPYIVSQAYGDQEFSFGPEYIIPKPFDPRVLYWVAPAVARAAMETRVARKSIDLNDYPIRLQRIFSQSRSIIQALTSRAQRRETRLLFPEGTSNVILGACAKIIPQRFARPILLGDCVKIEKHFQALGIEPGEYQVIDPKTYEHFDELVEEFSQLRKYKGVTPKIARQMLSNNNYFGAMLLRRGEADGMLSGATCTYPEAIRPALQTIGMAKGATRVYGLYIMIARERVFFFADTTVNYNPSAEELAEISILSADVVARLGIEPRVALISYSNFGNARGNTAGKMQQAAHLARKQRPELKIVGEVQADYAVSPTLAEELFPWLGGPANILIFPNLNSGNITYKLVQQLGNVEALGPILLGMKMAINIISPSADETEIVNLAVVTAAEIAGGDGDSVLRRMRK